MNTVRINKTISFHEELSALRNISTNTIFRGVSSCEHKLIPSIGRINIHNKTIQIIEKRLIVKFKESAIAYIDHVPNNEFEWLALAQHHGLPTRLLDWTYNPLVALFFAVEKEYEYDSRIYVSWKNPQIKALNKNPYQLNKTYRYRPSFVSQRIINQSSVFTIHPCPDEPYRTDNMMIIDIAVEIKRELKQMLFKYGINNKTMYPGLDGLTKDLKWLETDIY